MRRIHVLAVALTLAVVLAALPLQGQDEPKPRPWKGFKANLAGHLFKTKELQQHFNLKAAPRFVAEKWKESTKYGSAGIYHTERAYLHIAVYGADDDGQAGTLFDESSQGAAHSAMLEGIGRRCVAIVAKDPEKKKDGDGDAGSGSPGAVTVREPEREKTIVFLCDERPIVTRLTIHDKLGTLQNLVLLAKSANWRLNRL